MLLIVPTQLALQSTDSLFKLGIGQSRGTVDAYRSKSRISDDGNEDRSCCFQAELDRNQLYGNITDHIADSLKHVYYVMKYLIVVGKI